MRRASGKEEKAKRTWPTANSIVLKKPTSFTLFPAVVPRFSSSMPRPLRPGSLIAITAPAGYIPAERAQTAAAILESWGYRVRMGRTIGTGEFYFSGTDEERLTDLQAFLDDGEVEAILFARGGYGVSRIIDRIDFSAFVRQPKWLCGFSDITVLHSHIQAQWGIPTLHSPMCGAIRPDTAEAPHILSLRKALAGESLAYSTPEHDFNRPGTAEGILTGGNVAMLAHLSGSRSQVDTAGKILFIEDIGEHLYNIDRMLLNLQRAGSLDQIAGLVVGDFTDMEDTERPFGQTTQEIIRDRVAGFDFPVLFGFPSGHDEINFTLVLGAPHRLEVDASGGRLYATGSSPAV
jgi:muramoyltetrapeptide carboxypeptidase